MIETAIVHSEETNKIFCEWMAKQTNGEMTLDPYVAKTIAHVETEDGKSFGDKDIMMVSAFSQWTTHSAEVTLVSNGAKKAKATKLYIVTVLDFVFNMCGRSCLMARIPADNHKSMAVADMLGMRNKCKLEDCFGPGKDGYLYVLTKKQWLQGSWASSFAPIPVNTGTTTTNESTT